MRLARLAHGLSLEDTAARVGIDASTLSRFETGERRLPGPVLGNLGRVLQLDASAMQGRVARVLAGRVCAYCDGPMDYSRRTRRFCSSRCRVAAHREAGPGEHVVYFLVRGEHVKIGTTCKLRTRLNAMQQTEADLLATIPGDSATEREWHRRFAHLADPGVYGGREWFRLTGELRTAIAEVS